MSSTQQVNQIANLAALERHDNLAISASDPADYWPVYLDALRTPVDGMAPFTEPEIEAMSHVHGLAEDRPEMPYEEFLAQ